jgi:heme-degrading monooxygenase HmoA
VKTGAEIHVQALGSRLRGNDVIPKLTRRRQSQMFARTPEPPYTAVIFTSLRRPDDGIEYSKTAARMAELAQEQPGFLGVESVRDESGLGITVSYWKDASSATAWKQHLEHLPAQRAGRELWYQQYAVRICTVNRQATFGE